MAVGATAIWRVRPGGSNTNGGGFDAGISGAGTDYSQQNAAQASGTNGATVGTTDFADATANAFTSAMVGNAIYISGTGQTTGWYFVVAYVSASHVTLDRSAGTGTVATWNLGGGWGGAANDTLFTNLQSTGSPAVPGNIAYILGSGIPTPSSYTFDFVITARVDLVPGTYSAGYIRFAADPNTPSYASGGMPCIKNTQPSTMVHSGNYNTWEKIWTVSFTDTTGGYLGMMSFGQVNVIGSVHDQNGYDSGGYLSSGNVIGCEIFSSTAIRGTKTLSAIYLNLYGTVAVGNNIHDVTGIGIYLSYSISAFGNIIARCGGAGIYVAGSGATERWNTISNNTIDGNGGSGIEITSVYALSNVTIFNNIISNHTTASTYGMTVDAGSTPTNDYVKGFVDYNVFYNNTTDLNAISYGAHDTHGGSNPYVGRSTENFTLA